MKCAAMASEWLCKKNSNFYSEKFKLFHEIFNFPENMSKNRFREIFCSVHKIAKSKYFAKVITYSKSSDHMR